MRTLTLIALALVAGLQYMLWFGEGSVQEVWRLRDQIDEKRNDTQRLVERNRALYAEVNDLKSGLDAVEEIARTELGMIREDEVFFQLLDDPAAPRE
ncbi:MAG: cell division protein FtsB [Pseudomonadota bacterium]